MADNIEDIVIPILRQLQSEMSQLRDSVRRLEDRASAVEIGLAGVRRDLGSLAEADARLQVSFDQMNRRVERIERRLDLVEPD
ncbi:MAG: hypothetical protein AB7K86_18755 [Rhodospirillales bacterium]